MTRKVAEKLVPIRALAMVVAFLALVGFCREAEAAVGLDILNLAGGGALSINGSDYDETGTVLGTHDKAVAKDLVAPDATATSRILGLEIVAGRTSGPSENVPDPNAKLSSLATTTENALSLAALGILEHKGGLAIAKKITFREPTLFEKITGFLGEVVFRGQASFEKNPTFSKDMAGYAVIAEGQDKVKISFEQAYAQPPVINASLSLQQVKDEKVREAAEELLLVSDVEFIITDVTNAGFEIRVDRRADSDIPFAWQALAIKDARTFVSENEPVQEEDELAALADQEDIETEDSISDVTTEE